jgi:hypothetical protein
MLLLLFQALFSIEMEIEQTVPKREAMKWLKEVPEKCVKEMSCEMILTCKEEIIKIPVVKADTFHRTAQKKSVKKHQIEFN